MRARNSDTQGSAQEEFPRHSKDHSFQDMKHRQQDKDLTRESDALLSCPQSEKPHSGNGHQAEDLSRDDLLFLLSILEGELQVSWIGVTSAVTQGKATCEFGVHAATEIDYLWFIPVCT
jgi:hypothetical protein